MLGTIAVKGTVETPFTTTLLPDGSNERTVPETVIGEPPADRVCEPTTIGVWVGEITAESGRVVEPPMTTLLPDGSRDRTVPETVTGGPPGVRVWDAMTGGTCGVVEGEGAPVSWVGVLVGWTGAGSEVAGSEGSAGSEVAGRAGCGVLDDSTGGVGSEVTGGDGSAVLDGCVVGSAGEAGVDVS